MNAAVPDLEALAVQAVEAALAAGATDAEAYVSDSVSREIRVYDGAVESLTDAGARGIGVRAFDGPREGYAYGTDLTSEGIGALAERARSAAQVVDTDEHAGLPDDPGAGPVAGLRSAAMSGWSTERKVALALEVERAARARPGVSQVEQAVYSDTDGTTALANSRGFRDSYEASYAYAYASAFAGEAEDLATGLGVGFGRDPDALDPEAIGAEAGERAAALVGGRQTTSRRCAVVLDPFVAASFAGFIGGMLSADAVQRGRSLFAGREGQQIASPTMRLTDDGLDPEGLASAPFDGEGSAQRRTPLIEDGRLLTYLFDARTARRAGRRSTGNAGRGYRSPPSVTTTNLVIEPGEGTLPELIERAGDGLLVTDVAGLHSGVNPVSGTFSVGAGGRLIEGGELAAPVREITIASDLVSMLQAVDAVGSEARWVPFGGSVLSAPLLIAEMAVGGK